MISVSAAIGLVLCWGVFVFMGLSILGYLQLILKELVFSNQLFTNFLTKENSHGTKPNENDHNRVDADSIQRVHDSDP